MGLGSFFKRNKKTDTPAEEENTISIDQNKCLNLECQKCISICPSGVFISDEGITVVGDASRCSRCFRCQAVCPSEAISLQ